MPKEYDAHLNQLTDDHRDEWGGFLSARLGIPAGPVQFLDTDLATSIQADRLFRIDGPVPAVIHVEFDSSGHLGRPARLLRYNVLANQRAGLPVHSVALLLRPKADASDLTGELVQTGADGRPYLTFRYHVLRMWREPIEALLAAGPGLAPLALLTDESKHDPIGAVDRIQTELRLTGMSVNVMRELLNAALSLGGLRYDDEQIVELTRRVSMSVDLTESSYYRLILKEGRQVGIQEGRQVGIQEGRQVGIQEGRQVGIQEGRQVGIQEGRQEGREEGRRLAAQDFLLRVAGNRFGKATASVEAAIRAIDDQPRLDRMTDRILEATDWDDLLATP